MLRPTISNEKCSLGRGSWYTQITVPLGKVGMVTGASPGYRLMLSEYCEATLISNSIHTNGRQLQIPDCDYTPPHPQSISLEDCEGDWNSSSIQFTATVTLPFDGKLGKGKYVESDPIPLYHSHVLWTVAQRLDRVGDDEYIMSTMSMPPHLHGFQSTGLMLNVPPGLTQPPLTFGIPQIHNSSHFSDDDDPDMGTLTKQKILDCAVDGKLTVTMSYTVPRNYFSLDKIIDLKKKPTVSEDNRKVVETILRGEKPAGADWSIANGFGTGGAGVTHRYHMHMATLAERSRDAKEGLAMRKYYPKEKVDEGQRTTLDDAGLRTAVRIAYGVEVPLPDTATLANFGTLSIIFKAHLIKDVVPQWQREICRRALALNPRDPTPSSIVESLNLLSAIWEAPIGWFPVAKRVAIGVLADMVHLNTRSSVFDFVQTTILPRIPDSDLSIAHLPTVLGSMMMHLNTVSRVRKTAVDSSSGGAGHPPVLAPTVPHDQLSADDTEDEESSSDSASTSGDQRSSEDEESSLTSLDSESVVDNEKNEDTVEKEDTVTTKSKIDTAEKKDTVEVAAREDGYDAESGGVENPDENA